MTPKLSLHLGMGIDGGLSLRMLNLIDLWVPLFLLGLIILAAIFFSRSR